MISYFKYDNGNAFSLDYRPYSGFFHVVDGKAYTGKTFTASSRELSSIGNFISEFYLNRLEFDITTSDGIKASPFVMNSFDILNKTNIDHAFDQINSNNLLVFKHLVIQNPELFKINRTNTHFYGLSSTDADVRNDDVPSGKRSYTHIDPFSFDSDWFFLDSITSGDFIVDSNDNFLYFCTTGQKLYTLSGSFASTQPLALINSKDSDTFYIKQDTVDDKLFIVSLSGIDILDLQNFTRCQTYNILDSITSITDPAYKHLIKIGKNLRSEISSNLLTFRNKYSTVLHSQISYEELGISEILALDLRDVDDFVIFLGYVGTDLYFGSFDPNDRSNTYKLSQIYNITSESTLAFSPNDSNVFYTSNNATIQGRLISKPQYQFGNATSSSYFYLKDYIYGTTREYWNRIQIKYNSNSMPSNSFNNILFRIIPSGDNQYILTHNIGRIYASKLQMDDNYIASVPLDIQKSYNGTKCSESSFGLFFNVTVSNLVKDILRLRSLAAETYSLNNGVLTKNVLPDLDIELQNLYLNGNESINIVSIQRILSLINNIQNELISGT
jgi:hypothetical protein